jgi:hypothetical protein
MSCTNTLYYPYQRYIATFQATECEVLGSSDVLEWTYEHEGHLFLFKFQEDWANNVCQVEK